MTAVILLASSLVYAGIALLKAAGMLLLLPAQAAWGAPPPPSYQGRVFLILGASGGLGKDMALQAAERGATLVLAARRIEQLEAVAEECRQRGAEVHALQVDVAKEQDTQRCIDFVREKHGKLDLLILNAAIPGPWAPIDQLKDYSVLRTMMDINYWGYVTPTIQALPLLKQSQGTILVVSSMYGLFLAPFQAGYAATKHAINGFFAVLQQELLPHNVTLHIHFPGGILTEVQSKFQTSAGETRHLGLPAAFLGDSAACAADMLAQYDAGQAGPGAAWGAGAVPRGTLQYYPAYVGLAALVRNIFPGLFDWGFHFLTRFYFESGVIELG
uniref:Ketoreductase domain-containing protein n=1 Tax=Arcella intermedia TaxID=1963864 RepID=A0A6B2LAC9_9EUKA